MIEYIREHKYLLLFIFLAVALALFTAWQSGLYRNAVSEIEAKLKEKEKQILDLEKSYEQLKREYEAVRGRISVPVVKPKEPETLKELKQRFRDAGYPPSN